MLARSTLTFLGILGPYSAPVGVGFLQVNENALLQSVLRHATLLHILSQNPLLP